MVGTPRILADWKAENRERFCSASSLLSPFSFTPGPQSMGCTTHIKSGNPPFSVTLLIDGFSGAGVTGYYELPDMGARNCIGVLWKSRKCS